MCSSSNVIEYNLLFFFFVSLDKKLGNVLLNDLFHSACSFSSNEWFHLFITPQDIRKQQSLIDRKYKVICHV